MGIDGLDDKPCTLCSFWAGQRCTHTWRLTVHIEPTGGQMDFSITPGMVPSELEATVNKFFRDFMDKLAPAIEKWPIWTLIREHQLTRPDLERCPGRQVRRDVPYLHVVPRERLDLAIDGRKV